MKYIIIVLATFLAFGCQEKTATQKSIIPKKTVTQERITPTYTCPECSAGCPAITDSGECIFEKDTNHPAACHNVVINAK